jgi:transcriptional regulator with XRE-family HTH domain
VLFELPSGVPQEQIDRLLKTGVLEFAQMAADVNKQTGGRQMLDMKQAGKRIKNARTKKNMTQLELADRVGVSYQAVSNWERGVSMPDIAKLPDIARVLGLSISELLEEENHPAAAAAINKALDDPEAVLSPAELAEIAPILPPDALKEKVEKTPGDVKYDLRALVELAPYLDDDYLNELIRDAELSDMSGILELAPYLSDEALLDISRRLDPDRTDDLAELAEYLPDEALFELTRRMESINTKALAELAPFLPDKALDELASRFDTSDTDSLYELAGYLSNEALDSLTDRLLREGKTAVLIEIADYLSTESVRKLADHMLKNKDIDGLSKIKDYL